MASFKIKQVRKSGIVEVILSRCPRHLLIGGFGFIKWQDEAFAASEAGKKYVTSWVVR